MKTMPFGALKRDCLEDDAADDVGGKDDNVLRGAETPRRA